jgi:hypothetical protein
MKICDRCSRGPAETFAVQIATTPPSFAGHSTWKDVDLCAPCRADHTTTVKRWLEPLPQVKP